MKCKHCGEEIDNDSNFCEYCGESVNNDVAGIEKKVHNSKAKKFWWYVICVVAVGILSFVVLSGYGYGSVITIGVAIILIVAGLRVYYIAFYSNNKDDILKNN